MPVAVEPEHKTNLKIYQFNQFVDQTPIKTGSNSLQDLLHDFETLFSIGLHGAGVFDKHTVFSGILAENQPNIPSNLPGWGGCRVKSWSILTLTSGGWV